MHQKTFSKTMEFLNKHFDLDTVLNARAIRANVLGTIIQTRNYLDFLQMKPVKRKFSKKNRNV